MGTALVGTVDEKIDVVVDRIRQAQVELQLMETVARGPGRREQALAYVAGSSGHVEKARGNADEVARLSETLEGLVELRIDLEGESLEEQVASVQAAIAQKDRAQAETMQRIRDLQERAQAIVPGCIIDVPPNATRDSTGYERARLGDLQRSRNELLSASPAAKVEMRARVLRGERPI